MLMSDVAIVVANACMDQEFERTTFCKQLWYQVATALHCHVCISTLNVAVVQGNPLSASCTFECKRHFTSHVYHAL